ncbi:hypothetical protein V5799_014821 [Amblyomma americanum]|uniref:Uncharacterized protein n=1 Tax=Amblyomma americanum TaxID=6943 RepID=A0AAQ4E1X4_AMBAM
MTLVGSNETTLHRKQGAIQEARAVSSDVHGGPLQSADVEVHFTVGESLCCAVLGATSPLCRDPWTTEEAEFQPPVGTRANLLEMEWLVSQLLDTYLCNPRPAARQVYPTRIPSHC